MNQVTTVGVDLAKNIFHVHCVDSRGNCLSRRKFSRSKLSEFFATLPGCLVGMEACGSSHFWAREISKFGHTVKLMPPQYVKLYVKTNNNDAADAEAICEAVTRPSMRFVNIKTADQQTILLIHREREGAIKERTALINRIRATLLEFGITIPAGPTRMRRWFCDSYGQVEAKLNPLLSRHIGRMRRRLVELESHIMELEKEIDMSNAEQDACARLLAVPGIGRLTASALVATVGDGRAFRSGRQFSAWLGLVPKQHSTGGKTHLQGISKRGDSYLRRMLIHGARAVMRHMNENRSIYKWVTGLARRAHRNVVIVALANKLARVAWSLLSKGTKYQETYA